MSYIIVKADGSTEIMSEEKYRKKYLTPAEYAPVRHAKWVALTECSNEGVYCSLCHKKVYRADYAWCNKRNKVRSNYCPNCGARMDLEEEWL